MSENIEKNSETVDSGHVPSRVFREKLLASAGLALIFLPFAFAISLQIMCTKTSLREPQIRTVDIMDEVGPVLDRYQICENKFPGSLEEVVKWYDNLSAEEKDRIGYNLSIPLRDGWGNEFEYTSDGYQWKLTSFGADGKPGGYGIDADVFCTEQCYRWHRAVMMQDCFLKAYPSYGQTLAAEWPVILKWSAGGAVLLWPVFLCFYLTKKTMTKEKYRADILTAVVWWILLYIFLRFLGIALFYCLPGD